MTTMRDLLIFILLLGTFIFLGCSNTEDAEVEPGSIQSRAEEIGHEAARMIKEPMEKASDVADKENLRSQQLEEQLNKIE
jgi:hypothetical protein